ncbi:C39 family peptidase [Blautia wexlerae]|uniref:C39 family peptidase n=2 Tax=Blautia TaxID=572511 RepID=UPI00210E707D|nr:C39 family peptidase [Blautia wexlerae]MCQ5297069.1 C39 family peptidase [Blautia wexlerae]
MKKKHVLILFTVLALSVTSVMKLIPVSKVAASSILGGNKNESILDKLTPTPEPGKSDKNEKDDSNVLGEKDSLSTNMTDSLTDLMNNLLSRVGDEEYSLLTKVLSQTDDDLIEDDSDTDDGDKDKDDEKKASINRVVYIGDSRTEGLRDVNSDSKNTFICLSSMGYDWMLSTAFPQAESYASSGTAFVILMGVNDLYHQNSYISAINQKAAEWKKKGAVVYFASVGPVQNDPYTSNSEIESFNRALKNGLSSDVGYIDLYGELNKSGYQTVDGTHYTNTVSKNILSFIGKQVALGGSGNSDPYATDGNKVWWCRNNKEMALLEYKVSDWTKFSGLDVSLRADTKIEAKLSDEIKKYEEELEAAAKEYGFEAYVELFKALAEQRHYDGKKDDIFNMSGTSLNPNPDKTLSRADSIELAAELFSACITATTKIDKSAIPPAPSDVDGLRVILQAFEFESDGFVDYCKGEYSEDKALEYAKTKSGNKERTDANEIQQKGKWDFKDQKYPPKVLQFYHVLGSSGGIGTYPANGMKIPHYLQTDYANVPYGSSNIAACGCGPTSFAMVASYLTGTTITPADAVAWCGNSYYVWGAGTSWSYFEAAAKHFGCGAVRESYDANEVLKALSEGHPVISSQHAGLFTRGGHFIVLRGVENGNKVLVNDPNDSEAKNYINRSFDMASEVDITSDAYFIFESTGPSTK